VLAWEQRLEPRERHFDKRESVVAPGRLKAGAYLVTASVGDVEGGREQSIAVEGGRSINRAILWVADTVIVQKAVGSASRPRDAERDRDVARYPKIFFLPDELLATNTAHDLGLPADSIVRYDPTLPDGGVSDAQLATARMVVWKGFCHVHTLFRLEHVYAARSAHPEARIIIHPETPKEVVRLCDAHGSTAQIIDYVLRSPEGSTLIVGTEHQLVQRLAEEQKGKRTILALQSSTCPNMARTTETAVLDILQRWPAENRVSVPEAIASDARLCLQRMLEL